MAGKIEVWECSDGYITKSEAIYKRREKVLKKMHKAEKRYAEKGDNYLETFLLGQDLKKASRSDEQIAKDRSQAKYEKWAALPENICTFCEGRGNVDWVDSGYGTDRHYTSPCKECNQTGLNKQARDKVDNGKKF